MTTSHFLALRTCNADMSSRNRFRWPLSGPVEAPDWRDDDKCGGGLHALKWGCGSGVLLGWHGSARWLVVRVPEGSERDLKDKVKFPRGEVIFVGDRLSAIDYLLANGAAGMPVVGATVSAGDHGRAVVGDFGEAMAGNYGTAVAGLFGTASAGDFGTASVGNHGRASAGYGGMASAGDYGTMAIRWSADARERAVVARVGENGIRPGALYRLGRSLQFTEVRR